jgi:hypothetical protein
MYLLVYLLYVKIALLVNVMLSANLNECKMPLLHYEFLLPDQKLPLYVYLDMRNENLYHVMN